MPHWRLERQRLDRPPYRLPVVPARRDRRCTRPRSPAESGTQPWFVTTGGRAGADPEARPDSALTSCHCSARSLLTTLLAYVVSRRVDLNEFSLHALYRNRLVRCYLGASNERRSAHPFTGFDSNDDLPLAPADATHRGLGLRAARGVRRRCHRSSRTARIRPYPLFNVALNLVGGKNLAWQQRKAASFIFSPEYCGFEYRVDEDNEQERRSAPGAPASPRRRTSRSAYAPTDKHASDRTSLTRGPRGGDLRRGRVAEHGLSLVADARVPDDDLQRAPGLVAAQSAMAGGLDRRAHGTVSARAAQRAARHDHRRPRVGVPVRRRSLREPRRVRAGAPSLPLHHRQRRRPGRRA